MDGLSRRRIGRSFSAQIRFCNLDGFIQNWVISKRLEIPSLDFSGKVCDPDLTQNLSPDMQ